MNHSTDQIKALISLGLQEDIGSGDVTSLYFVAETRRAVAHVTLRQDGFISGADVAEEVFKQIDPEIKVVTHLQNGTSAEKGSRILSVEGSARSILTAERTALNLLQHLCGIATLTSKYVELIKHTKTRILDTRKTLAGYRFLEKKAVIHGGGKNHRMGLYDRAMVKDNHLMMNGDPTALQEAILRLKGDKPSIEVELEADHLEQVESFLKLEGVDYILLDNMNLEQLRHAVKMRGASHTVMLEASGGVNLHTVKDIAETGVDFISVGAITHSAPALDIGLDFENIS